MREHYGVPDERMFTTHIAVHQRFAALARGRVHRAMPARTIPFSSIRRTPGSTKTTKRCCWLTGSTAPRRADGRKRLPGRSCSPGTRTNAGRKCSALAGTLGLLEEGAVQFRGYVAPEEFGRLWETAGALVFPSLHEGFGIPLLEAMQHDLPVFTSRDGSLPEVGADACLYADVAPPGGPRRRDDPARHRRQICVKTLVAAGRRRLADFSFDRESTRLLDAIVELSRHEAALPPAGPGHFPGRLDGTLRHAGPAQPATGRFRAGPPDPAFPSHARAPEFAACARGRLFALGQLRPAGPPSGPSEITVDFQADRSALWLEIPDAANLNASATGDSTASTCSPPICSWLTAGSSLCLLPDENFRRHSFLQPGGLPGGDPGQCLPPGSPGDRSPRFRRRQHGRLGANPGTRRFRRPPAGRSTGFREKDRGQADAINQGSARQQRRRARLPEFRRRVLSRRALDGGGALRGAPGLCLALYGRAHHLHADGSIMEEYATEPWDYDRLLETCYLCQPAVFWRREVMERFGVFDDTLRYALDYEYWLRLGQEISFDYLDGHFLAGSRLHADTKTLSQRVPVHLELAKPVQEIFPAPGAGLAVDQALGAPPGLRARVSRPRQPGRTATLRRGDGRPVPAGRQRVGRTHHRTGPRRAGSRPRQRRPLSFVFHRP